MHQSLDECEAFLGREEEVVAVFLTGASIPVMAMLVLRVAARSVSAISGHLPIACP